MSAVQLAIRHLYHITASQSLSSLPQSFTPDLETIFLPQFLSSKASDSL